MKFIRIPLQQRVVEFGLIVTLAILISCGARAKVMSGAFSICIDADLGKVVDNAGTTLESAVAAIIEENSTALETALGALAAVVGIDAIDCAIAAVEAAFPSMPAAGSGSGSAVLSSGTTPAPSAKLARDVGFARAHQFVKDWRAGKKPAALQTAVPAK